MTCLGSSLWSGVTMASVNITIINIAITVTHHHWKMAHFLKIPSRLSVTTACWCRNCKRRRIKTLCSLLSSPRGFVSHLCIFHIIIKDWKFEYSKIMWTMTQLIIPHPPASLWAIASVAGCLLGSVLSDFLGRRKALMVHSFFTLHTVVDLSYYRLLVRVWIIILSMPT